GFSDAQLGWLWSVGEDAVRARRLELGVGATFKTVDTCGAEFDAKTPYHYSTYEDEDEVQRNDRRKVVILGSGPNRIGQGIEFDYCCVHASFALRDAGFETVMVNCNPETVSTDYDTSDRLYFEPLTVEDVLEVVDAERESARAGGGELVGVIVQLGGQTPLRLAQELKDCGVPIVGTSPEAIHLAEDRDAFGKVMTEGGLPSPKSGMAASYDEAASIATEVGYPVLVRPSYVLGGRGMEIVYSDEDLRRYFDAALSAGTGLVLVDKYVEGREVEVDAVSDGAQTLVAGIMEHVERAGVHS